MTTSPGFSDVPDVPFGQDGLVEVGVYATEADGFDHGLVVLAMELPFVLAPHEHSFGLFVDSGHAEEVREELSCFDREAVGWPPRPAPEPAPLLRTPWVASLVWALATLIVFWCQQEWPQRLEDAGELDVQPMFGNGEWWRALTALFLHADVGHLASNLLAGFFVFSTVLGAFRIARGTLVLVGSSALANLVSVTIRYPGPYRSLGASTAIFAGLGMLTGARIRLALGPGPKSRRWRILPPLAAGLALLGLFGAGGPNTDIGAHASGFVVGLVAGTLFCRQHFSDTPAA